MLASAAAVLVVTGYAVADVLDAAPGVLTRDRAVPVPTPTVSGTPAPVLLPAAASSVPPVLTDTGADAPVPTADGIQDAVTAASGDPRSTGRRHQRPRRDHWRRRCTRSTPHATRARVDREALAALAVADGLDLGVDDGDPRRRAARSRRPRPRRGRRHAARAGAGDPEEVAGRAGVADLATQVADALAPAGATVRLRLDLTWAPARATPRRGTRTTSRTGSPRPSS